LFKQLATVATSLTRTQKFGILLGVDILLVPFSIYLTAWLSNVAFDVIATSLLKHCLIMVSVGVAASVVLGLPRLKLNSYEQTGMQKTAAYGFLSVSARFLMRNLLVFFYHRGHQRQRVLIYGAGQTGVQFAMALHTDDAVEPVAFIDDNKTLQKVYVAGLQVFPPVHLEKIVQDLRIDKVVLAMPSISRPKQARLSHHLSSLGCDVAILPSFASLVSEGALIDRVQPANPSEFLGRMGFDDNVDSALENYGDQCVMITGAGGSIGSELARQILAFAPKKIVLFEASEYALFQIERELSESLGANSNCELVPILGSVTDEAKVTRTLTEHGVEIVFHAAAYKHVTLVERNRLSGLYNNVFGTYALVRAARSVGVKNFILVSTDKAVNPTNVMGASKRVSELILQDAASRCDTTRFDIVRFGNVLGSSGSVVPLFEEQISRGGPITLTHPEVTRYFMTISEAARLVLHVGGGAQASADQGQVYLLDMGAPIPIKTLARQMIEHRGYTVRDAANPSGDIEIIVTGLNQGEKLHEELSEQGYKVRATSHPKIKQVQEVNLSEIETATVIRGLKEAIETDNEDMAMTILRRWVVHSHKAPLSAFDTHEPRSST